MDYFNHTGTIEIVVVKCAANDCIRYRAVASTVFELERSTHRPDIFPKQFITASTLHPKHFAHTLRPTTCVAFGCLLTLDMVTDGRGSKLSQREPSRNSTERQ